MNKDYIIEELEEIRDCIDCGLSRNSIQDLIDDLIIKINNK